MERFREQPLRHFHSRIVLVIAVLLSFLCTAEGSLRFEVFPGYDSITREGHWFPVTIEVQNDGPTFPAVIEVSAAQMNRNQSRRLPLELPTGTLKRVTIPVFSSSRYGAWNVKLLTERGKVLDERSLSYQSLKQRSHDTPVVGALSRTVAGAPVFPQVKSNSQGEQVQPSTSRLAVPLFPDNPLALDGLQTIYLNSERALDLKVGQVNALFAWLQTGGHLIVSVEQITDVNGNEWLRGLLPMEFSGTKMVSNGNQFKEWVRDQSPKAEVRETKTQAGKPSQNQAKTISLWTIAEAEMKPDSEFQSAQIEIATGRIRDGKVLAQLGDVPLAVVGERGRGRITVLTFSPERQPFVGWVNRQWFWAMLAEVSPKIYEPAEQQQHYGGYSSDGVFGSMIESKQIRKLPLTWLLLLLVVYLVVIGPFDQMWLKRINKQMLTWITFPLYVVFFSALIYFIGFKLRAGDSEYNELHIVDVLPSGGDKAILRGRTFVSIYSPSNERYVLEGEQPVASLRGEYMANWGNGQESSQATVVQRGNSFTADVFVPVWTSQLYVNDWMQPVSSSPVSVSFAAPTRPTLRNNLDRKLTDTRLCISGKIYEIGDLEPKQTKEIKLDTLRGIPMKDFVRSQSSGFFSAIDMRRQTFGGDENKRTWDLPVSSMAASFITQANEQDNYRRFVVPGSLDLSPLLATDCVILLAWDAKHSMTKPLNRFTPRRHEENTLLRIIVPKNPTL